MAAADQQVTSESPPSDQCRFLRDPRQLTLTLKSLLLLFLLVKISILCLNFGQWNPNVPASESIAADTRDIFSVVASVIDLGLLAVTGIVFICWEYQAYLNCRGFGAANLQFKPDQSITSCLSSSARSNEMLQEIWRVSSDPQEWQLQQKNRWIDWWWRLFYCAAGVSFVNLAAYSIKLPDSSKLLLSVEIVADCVEIVFLIGTYFLVSRILAKQQALVKQHLAT